MKKQLLLGMVMLVMAAGQQSFAAPIRSMEALRTEIKKSKEVELKDLDLARGVEAVQMKNKLAEALSALTGGQSSVAISNVLKRGSAKIEGKVAGVKQIIEVDFVRTGKDIAHAEQVLKTVNRNELDAAGKIHMELLERAVKSATKMLAAAEKTSDMRDIDSHTDLTAAQKETLKQETAAFAQEVSLISEALKMDTADLQTFVEVWEKVAAKRGPGVNGDQAYAAVQKEGRTEQAYREKLEEVLGCVR